MTAPHADQIVSGYLARLEVELGSLPATRRQELIDEVRSHIDESRAGLTNETDADILNILDRLGSPAEVAAAERDPEQVAAGQSGAAAGLPAAIRHSNLLEILAIIFLLVFWPVGVILLWLSDTFRTREKMIGTLVPPGGFLATLIVIPLLLAGAVGPVCQSNAVIDSLGHTISGTTCPQGLAAIALVAGLIVLLLFYLVGPIFTAAYLAARLRRYRKADLNPLEATLA